jgi:hypothetical protein
MILSSTERKEIRKFGIVSFIFFGSLSILGFWNQKQILGSFFSVLCVMGIVFILLPAQLKPVHRLWIKAAHFIGRINTLVVLVIIYYVVITPTALLKRLFGGRPLPLKPDKKVSSYWVKRTEPAQPQQRFLKQF